MSKPAAGLKAYTKQFSLKTLTKAAGADITDELLAKVNSFAQEALTREDIYIRKFILAHNGVDRDRERFPEKMLDDFAATLPGMSFLKFHEKRDLPIGLWFDTSVEEMTPEEFKALTKSDAKLPKHIKKVKVLWAWVYTLATEAEVNKKIDAGICRYVSIGFRAADLNAVKDDPNGAVKYYEYVCPGEATEGSLVWLGAQQGAGVQKGLFAEDDEFEPQKQHQTQGGVKTVEELLKSLGIFFEKTFSSEGDLVTHIKALIAGKEKAETGLTESQDKVKSLEGKMVEMKKELDEAQEKIKSFEPLEVKAKALRVDMEKRYVAAKAKLKEVGTEEDSQKSLKEFVGTFADEFLVDEVKHLEARVHEKFPDESQTEPGKPDSHHDKSGEKDTATESGKKAAKDNPLKPKKKEDA